MSQTDTHSAPLTDKELVPRVLIRAVLALVLSVLALVTYARVTDRPLEAVAPQDNIIVSRDLILGGDMAGRATVHGTDGALIAELSPEKGGFIAGVYRVLHRERTKHGVALDGPLTLRLHEGGRLSIYDASTGWHADLMGFGADNARAFAQLLAE